MEMTNVAVAQMTACTPVQQGAIEAAMGGDAFGQLLMLLMGNQQEMGDLLAQMGQARRDGEQEGTDLAGQMMAELLFGGSPMAAELMARQTETEAQMVELVQSQGGPAQELLAQWAGGQGLDVNASREDWEQMLQQLSAASAPSENGTAQTVEGQPLPVTAVEQHTAEEPLGDLLQGQTQFLGSVTAAKQELSAEQKEEKNAAQPLDLEQLQQWVDAKRFLPEGTAVKAVSANRAQAPDLMTQVSSGIKLNLADGKNEFVVKLEPEGMGQITVKMVESEGKITLSILASNSQVAKALNSGLAELQNSLRPYHTEVHQVVTETSAAWQENAAGSNQNFGGHQHQQFQDQRRQPLFYEELDQLDDRPVDPLTAAWDSELDTYI